MIRFFRYVLSRNSLLVSFCIHQKTKVNVPHTTSRPSKSLILVLMILGALPAWSQSFLNGSFETNTAGPGDRINLNSPMFNGFMSDVNSFGTIPNLDIIRSASWGGSGAQHLSTYVALTGGATDAMAMTLSAPLVAGTSYTMSFWDRKDPGFPAFPVQIGLSTTNSSVGTIIYTAPSAPVNNTWVQRVFSFVAPNSGQYIIVTQAGGASTTAWAHVDNFEFNCFTPTLTVSPSATVCAGSARTLTVSGGTSYTWTPAAGLSVTSGSAVVASPGATTIYSVTSGVGTCTGMATVKLNVDPVPTLSLNPSVLTICPGSSGTFSVAGASSYTWSPAGSLSSANGATVTASPATSTSYTVTGGTGACTNTMVATVNVMASPTIGLVPQATVCAGSSLTLTASGMPTYTWSPSSGLSSTSGAAVVASPSAATVYSVIGGSGTCTAIAQCSVTVDPVPSLTLTPSGSSMCAGSSATLSASGASSYTWAPAASVTTGSLVTLAPSATTIYTVTGAINSCTASATATLNVIPDPTLSVVPNTTVCAGSWATLTVSGAASYTWMPGTITGSTAVLSPTATEVYTITGSVNSCTASATTTLGIVPRPAVVSGPDADICSGSTTTLSATGASAYSWAPSTALSSTTGPTVNASPGSTTTYTVTGTSAGCSATASVTVRVMSTPTVVIVAQPASICKTETSFLSATGAVSYSWSPAATLDADNIPDVTASPAQTTTYTVIGTNGSCTASATVEVIVIQTVTVQASKFGDVCFGEYTTIEAIGGTTYNWLPVSGLSNANGASTRAAPLVTTVYTVTASAPGLCSSTSTVEVKVNPLPHVYAGRDTTINIDETITLTGTGDVEVGFLAPTATPLACNYCNQITVNPQEPTCYVLKGENGYGCVDFDTVCVYVTKDFDVFIPNAFTPNEDGYNDIFIPVGYGIEAIRLTVFDRWGVQIFTSYENNIGWDGSYKGKQCEQGVYTYKAEIKTMAGHTVQRAGHVTLLPKGRR